jgi:hypothetical protein
MRHGRNATEHPYIVVLIACGGQFPKSTRVNTPPDEVLTARERPAAGRNIAMRIRTFSLLVPVLVLVAACGSTASSPSAAAPSVAAPSVAPSVAPSESASAAPSVAPSEPPASVDPGAAFRDETLQPVLDEISTALTRWGEAATAAAAPDAPDTARIALAGAAFRARVALESGTAILAAAEVPECATPVRDDATTFIAGLTESSQELLGDDSASPDDVNAVIQQASDGAPPLLEALATACA